MLSNIDLSFQTRAHTRHPPMLSDHMIEASRRTTSGSISRPGRLVGHLVVHVPDQPSIYGVIKYVNMGINWQMEEAVSNAPYASLTLCFTAVFAAQWQPLLLSLLLAGSLLGLSQCMLPLVLGVAWVPPLAASLLILVSPCSVYLL